MKRFLILLFALTLGIIRFFTPTRTNFGLFGTYEALAHMVVGGLLACYFCTKEKIYLWAFLILTLVEVLCFIIGKKQLG